MSNEFTEEELELLMFSLSHYELICIDNKDMQEVLPKLKDLQDKIARYFYG